MAAGAIAGPVAFGDVVSRTVPAASTALRAVSSQVTAPPGFAVRVPDLLGPGLT
ncbi:hypothetical protein Afil01_15810 [Actinorhabdospora filicis]|uniref:Uncharacterized protein n=1 Tax=Actinorhabdospora filicis TaxID=1785913 RepID=A0A9W6W7P5_9ACTN|nr:hypothetical protein Afil01_15810 [Actinorhabdospora filicis]